MILGVLSNTTSAGAAATECGDVDSSGSIGSSDALRVLRKAVGLEETLLCPTLNTCSTTTISLHEDECFVDSDCVGNPDGAHCCTFECSECDTKEHCPPGYTCGSCSCIPPP